MQSRTGTDPRAGPPPAPVSAQGVRSRRRRGLENPVGCGSLCRDSVGRGPGLRFRRVSAEGRFCVRGSEKRSAQKGEQTWVVYAGGRDIGGGRKLVVLSGPGELGAKPCGPGTGDAAASQPPTSRACCCTGRPAARMRREKLASAVLLCFGVFCAATGRSPSKARPVRPLGRHCGRSGLRFLRVPGVENRPESWTPRRRGSYFFNVAAGPGASAAGGRGPPETPAESAVTRPAAPRSHFTDTHSHGRLGPSR